MAYRHIVLFHVHDEISETAVDAAIAQLSQCATLPGVISWRIERSRDSRKGRVIVEDATFVDRAAFDGFRVTPTHLACGESMALISDWLIGDYDE